METLLKKRLVCLFALLALFFCILALRLASIQIIKGEDYTAAALGKESSRVALEDFPRGELLDRNLKPLGGGHRANRVVVFPEMAPDKMELARELGKILAVDPGEIMSVLHSGPALLPYELSPYQAGLINERLSTKGVLVAPVYLRYGPRPLAAQTVGHLGKINNLEELGRLRSQAGREYSLADWVGRQGLEKYYEAELRGDWARGYASIFFDARGNPLRGLSPGVETALQDKGRHNVVTTLDAGMQSLVEAVMDREVLKGVVVVMEVGSGDILAMASRPSYNPQPSKINAYLEVEKAGSQSFMDQGISLFQPGSVFKVVVAAAALSEGLVTPGKVFSCQGDMDSLIKCWLPGGHGEITFEEAFTQSCNPAFARLGMELGPWKIIKYAGLLGLDNQEVLGYPVPRDSRQDWGLVAGQYNLVNSSIGQGPVLATPVQLAAMMNTLASDGVYHNPRLVDRVEGVDGVKREINSPQGKNVLSPPVTLAIQKMLGEITLAGVGREAWVPGWGSAGKTGSAQEGYTSRVNAWFAGYVPLREPRYVITVLVKDGASGGQTAGPVFRHIAEGLMAGSKAGRW